MYGILFESAKTRFQISMKKERLKWTSLGFAAIDFDNKCGSSDSNEFLLLMSSVTLKNVFCMIIYQYSKVV